MRKLAYITLLIVAAVAGDWLAEDPKFPVAPFGVVSNDPSAILLTAAASLILLGIIAYGLADLPKWYSRVVLSLLVIASWFGGVVVGDRASSRALNECVYASDAVQATIAEFRLEKGRYPDSLTELDNPAPCRTPLRGTILRYQRTEDGYGLCFGDWLGSSCGDQDQPLVAHK